MNFWSLNGQWITYGMELQLHCYQLLDIKMTLETIDPTPMKLAHWIHKESKIRYKLNMQSLGYCYS